MQNVRSPKLDGKVAIVTGRSSGIGLATPEELAAAERHGVSRELKLGSRDLQGSQEIVDVVGSTPCAIGYSGLAYANEKVRVPCIESSKGVCVAPSQASALDGSYPIARPLFMYTATETSEAVQHYIEWVQSDVGQCIIQSRGYAPIRSVACQP